MTAVLKKITVVGAGIFGLWQALTLARAGHRVSLIEAGAEPFAHSASRLAGAMLAPYCEMESAEPLVRDLGLEGLRLWRAAYPDLVNNGSLVVAGPRDRSELARFRRMTTGSEEIAADRVDALEPDLAGRFPAALYFPDEAHMVTPRAMAYLLAAAQQAGAEVTLGTPWSGNEADGDIVIDCRGLAAAADLADLRGVRGERLLVRTHEIALRRPVRLLHPRYPLYIVPWGEGLHLVGATVLESDEAGPMTVRSALELLGMAYALHPAFGEAEIVDIASGVRPAFPDNVPKVVVRGPRLYVNGAYRHGFLLAPVMAAAVADFLATGHARKDIVRIE
jgi:glycine oxidase